MAVTKSFHNSQPVQYVAPDQAQSFKPMNGTTSGTGKHLVISAQAEGAAWGGESTRVQPRSGVIGFLLVVSGNQQRRYHVQCPTVTTAWLFSETKGRKRPKH